MSTPKKGISLTFSTNPNTAEDCDNKVVKQKKSQKLVKQEEFVEEKKTRGRKAKILNIKTDLEIPKIQSIPETLILTLPIVLDDLLEYRDSIDLSNIDDIYTRIKRTEPKNFTNINYTNKLLLNPSPGSIGISDHLLIDNYTSHGYANNIHNSTIGIGNWVEQRYGTNEEQIITYDSISLLPHNVYEGDNFNFLIKKKVNIACWWCTYTFDNYPVMFPKSYHKEDLKRKVKEHFKVIGVFCSFNCAKSYGILHYNKDSSLLYYLAATILDKSMTEIKINKAPLPTVLKKFGGVLDITEYRKSFTELIEYKYNIYPIMYIPLQIEVNRKKGLSYNVDDTLSIISDLSSRKNIGTGYTTGNNGNIVKTKTKKEKMSKLNRYIIDKLT